MKILCKFGHFLSRPSLLTNQCMEAKHPVNHWREGANPRSCSWERRIDSQCSVSSEAQDLQLVSEVRGSCGAEPETLVDLAANSR